MRLRRSVAGGAILLDVIARVGTIAVSVDLMGEFASTRIGPNGDGVPVVIFVPVVALYVLWNAAMVRWDLRWWLRRENSDSAYMLAIIALAIPRILVLRWLAGDIRYFERVHLHFVVAVSVTSMILAAVFWSSSRRLFSGAISTSPDRSLDSPGHHD